MKIITLQVLRKNLKVILQYDLKIFLFKNNFINEEWNALNILLQNASSVGAIDFGAMDYNDNNNFIFFCINYCFLLRS